ncbi:MAG TPA: hypothetical protein P5056_02840 [Candidatus Paceibacterota bacterium]|nr:hypothetical protein [Candidatus Paceibacterota bacterium]
MFGISGWAEKPFRPAPIKEGGEIDPVAPIDKNREEGERSDGERRENLEPHKGQLVDIEA